MTLGIRRGVNRSIINPVFFLQQIDTTQNSRDFWLLRKTLRKVFDVFVFSRYDAELIFVEHGEISGERFLGISESGDYPISCLESIVNPMKPAYNRKKQVQRSDFSLV